jgi:hypothetical protein
MSRLREEQTTAMSRLREEQTTAMSRLREEQTTAMSRLREEQTAASSLIRRGLLRQTCCTAWRFLQDTAAGGTLVIDVSQ